MHYGGQWYSLCMASGPQWNKLQSKLLVRTEETQFHSFRLESSRTFLPVYGTFRVRLSKINKNY